MTLMEAPNLPRTDFQAFNRNPLPHCKPHAAMCRGLKVLIHKIHIPAVDRSKPEVVSLKPSRVPYPVTDRNRAHYGFCTDFTVNNLPQEYTIFLNKKYFPCSMRISCSPLGLTRDSAPTYIMIFFLGGLMPYVVF